MGLSAHKRVFGQTEFGGFKCENRVLRVNNRNQLEFHHTRRNNERWNKDEGETCLLTGRLVLYNDDHHI